LQITAKQAIFLR